jgi:hypothetical protein
VSDGPTPTAERAAGDGACGNRPPCLIDLINVIAGAVFVRTGAADRVWRAIEPPTAWRTGPAWQATFAYFCLCAAGWGVLNVALVAAVPRAIPLERIVLRAGRFIVAACAVVIIQVLAPAAWPAIACAAALPPMLLAREPRHVGRRVLAWAWVAAGIAVAGLLVHPYFVGMPPFVPRLALCLTAWRMVGKFRPLRLGARDAWTPDWLP